MGVEKTGNAISEGFLSELKDEQRKMSTDSLNSVLTKTDELHSKAKQERDSRHTGPDK